MNYLELLRLKNRLTCTYPKCKHKFEDGLAKVEVENDHITSWSPNGEFLFHYHDSHGFPAEIMVEEMTRLVESKMSAADIRNYNYMMSFA